MSFQQRLLNFFLFWCNPVQGTFLFYSFSPEYKLGQVSEWLIVLISYYHMDWWIDSYINKDRNEHKVHLVVQPLIQRIT